jgi:hypothetical protein
MKPDQYRLYGAECLRLAKLASNESDRLLLLRMVDAWQRPAKRESQTDKKPPRPAMSDADVQGRSNLLALAESRYRWGEWSLRPEIVRATRPHARRTGSHHFLPPALDRAAEIIDLKRLVQKSRAVMEAWGRPIIPGDEQKWDSSPRQGIGDLARENPIQPEVDDRRVQGGHFSKVPCLRDCVGGADDIVTKFCKMIGHHQGDKGLVFDDQHPLGPRNTRPQGLI